MKIDGLFIQVSRYYVVKRSESKVIVPSVAFRTRRALSRAHTSAKAQQSLYLLFNNAG